MQICLVSQEYPPETAHGGIGSQNYNKARRLARLGHKVDVLSLGPSNGSELTSDDREGVIVHRMRSPAADVPIYTSAGFWVGYSWTVLRHLHALMQKNKFDVIDFAEYGAEGFAYQLERGPSNWTPVLVQLHGPIGLFSERIGWPKPGSDFAKTVTMMEGLSIRNADALMACSANIADFTADYYKVDRSEIDVVHCGVDAEVYSPSENSQAQRPTILFVGQLVPEKGLHKLFDAVLKIRDRFPDVVLQVVGQGSKEHNEAFKKRVRDANAEKNVDLVGFVADRSRLPDFYRKATVFCSAAYHELGVANVYIEAMGCGCPVIAARSGGAPEAISDGETGFLVPPNDVPALAEALSRVLSDRQRARQMGAAGRRRVEEYFAMDHYIDRVLRNYSRAIENSQRKLRAATEPE